jgi:isopentenyldiphosphate isomerase
MQIQTYQDAPQWKEGDTLVVADVVEKEVAHTQDLLHLATHLLVIDQNNRILSRHRTADDLRYPDKWTSSIGTHPAIGQDYHSTLLELIPIQKEMQYVGEFRVHDPFENEVNGLHIMKADEHELPAQFMADKKFFTVEEFKELFAAKATTPHLQAGVELLLQKKVI